MTTTAIPTPNHAQRLEELGRIIMAYSEVTEKLQASQDELKGKVEVLQRELSDKNRELERRNRLAALGEMAAGLAHEIRNPLGGIQLYVTVLQQDIADRPESLLVTKKILSGVQRMEQIVSQVLNFSREINAHPESCDVVQVVREAVELAQSKAHGRPAVGVVCDTPETLKATIDARLISQAVLNLTHNAIDAVSDAGTVTITLRHTNNRLALTIEDTGPGIPADILDRIFNPFFTTKDDGTGLGLSIVHRIVEAHAGVITATNKPEGGAKFEIRI